MRVVTLRRFLILSTGIGECDMFNKFTTLNPAFIEKLPLTSFTIKSNPTTTIDPFTGLQTTAYETEVETAGYVGTWRQDQIASSNGKLTLESLKVILTAQVSVSDILEIDSSDYRIDVLEIKQGYFVLGVNPT
jgi:hypothetical protein